MWPCACRSRRDVRWVDARGGQHPVRAEALAGALVDPFAFGGAALLARLNAAPDAPAVHASLCLAYLGATVAEAHLFCVDRSGFGLLGRDAAPDAEWREFRFAFSNEVRDVDALESTLRDMADEARAHVAAGGGAA